MPSINNDYENNTGTAGEPLSPNQPSQSLSNTSQRQIDALSASGSQISEIFQFKPTTPSHDNPKLEPSIISPGAADPAHHHSRDEHPPPAPTRSPSRFTSHDSYFSKQPGASGVEPQSPPSKRPKGPPASRSSRGVNNIAGPPPAFSTQRASFIVTTEDSRRPLPAYDHRGTPPRLTPQNLASLDAITSRIIKTESSVISGIKSSYHEAGNREIGGLPESAHESTLDTSDPAMIANALMESRQSRGEYYAGDEDDTLRGMGNGMTINGNASVERPRLGDRANTVGQSQEDLFLALANTDNNPVPLPNGSGTREKSDVSISLSLSYIPLNDGWYCTSLGCSLHVTCSTEPLLTTCLSSIHPESMVINDDR